MNGCRLQCTQGRGLRRVLVSAVRFMGHSGLDEHERCVDVRLYVGTISPEPRGKDKKTAKAAKAAASAKKEPTADEELVARLRKNVASYYKELEQV